MASIKAWRNKLIKKNPDINDDVQDHIDAFEDLDPAAQELYYNSTSDITDLNNQLYAQEIAAGGALADTQTFEYFTGETEDVVNPDTGETETVEKTETKTIADILPSLMHTMDNYYGDIGSSMSEVASFRLFPDSTSLDELKAVIRTRSHEKIEKLILPHITQLKSYKVMQFGPAQSAIDRVEKWLA